MATGVEGMKKYLALYNISFSPKPDGKGILKIFILCKKRPGYLTKEKILRDEVVRLNRSLDKARRERSRGKEEWKEENVPNHESSTGKQQSPRTGCE